MGQMRFLIPQPRRVTEGAAGAADLSGIDRVAWSSRSWIEDGQLVVERSVSDSGNLNIPWQVEGFGLRTISTASLMQRTEPYLLPLELARGLIGQLRDQIFDWQIIGLNIAEEIHEKTSQAMGHLRQTATNQEDLEACAQSAEAAIVLGFQAGELLARAYTEQSLAARLGGGKKLKNLFGCSLEKSMANGTAQRFLATFNAAVVPMCWRDIEASQGKYDWTVVDTQIKWCKANGLTVCSGPLLHLVARSIPNWMYLWEDDFDDLLKFVSEFVSATVKRFRGKVDVWQCAAGLITGSEFSLSEEQKLRLTASVVELVGELDPNTPVVLCFEQPWSEHTSHRDVDFPPLHFADALVRAGMELSGLMLSIDFGYHPDGTLPRGLLEFGRQLDYWGSYGLPLVVLVSAPSSNEADPLARHKVSIPLSDWTPSRQQAWAAQYLPLMLVKPYVQGVIWNQLDDSRPHDFPNGGLFDKAGVEKPSLGTLTAIRRAYLKSR